jgi:hypothetical protein
LLQLGRAARRELFAGEPVESFMVERLRAEGLTYNSFRALEMICKNTPYESGILTTLKLSYVSGAFTVAKQNKQINLLAGSKFN